MRIEQNSIVDTALKAAEQEKKDTQIQKKDTSFVQVEKSRKGERFLDAPTYGKPAREEGAAIEDIEQQACSLDAVQQKNEMLFAADRTTERDAKAMEDDGFSLHESDVHTVVTETDKIKMVLAEAGADISSFGDPLSKEQIEAMGGSPAMVQQAAEQMNAADIPLTDTNVSDVAESASMMEELRTPTEGSMKYMLDNELEVTPANLYKAQFSGSDCYMPNQDAQFDYGSMEEQIKAVITESGQAFTPENEANCKWMMENDIPLTKENLVKLTQLQQLELPMENSELLGKVIPAMQEGIRPQNAPLTDTAEDMRSQAEEAITVISQVTDEQLAYVIGSGKELTIENLKEARNKGVHYTQNGLDLLSARRQLEETRLMMSTEANRALLKKGISIDTVSLSELVENLKEQENSYYQKLLSADGIDASADNVSVFADTARTVEELKTMPSYALGMTYADKTTLQSLHREGAALQEAFAKAGDSYETMKTTPRSDMGDSISKAFSNIDDILTDLGMDTADSNERAVRILAYNQIEITAESVERMKAADEEVQRAFANLKPAVVRTMIKEGMNPLEMSFEELNQVSEQIQESQSGAEEEKFSKYLWKLEQNQDISQEERDSYIGIYRLIRQVEKTDGAAIGALIQQGTPLTMKNLLTQVRSAKHGKMDYAVDDEFGGVDAKTSTEPSITEQILSGYQKNCVHDVMDSLTPKTAQTVLSDESWLAMTPEQLAEQLAREAESDKADYAYAREQTRALQLAAEAPEAVYKMLERFDVPVTVNAVLAASEYMKNRNGVFRQLFRVEDRPENLTEELQNIQKKILEAFGEAVKTPEDMAKAQEQLAETAENVMKTMITEEEHVSTLDIRRMKLAASQIALGTAAAKEEQYAVPVLVQGELCSVSLKIVRGEERKGLVDIVFGTEHLGKVAAEFKADGRGIRGYITADSQKTAELLAGQEELLKEGFGLSEEKEVQIDYVTDKQLDTNTFGAARHNKQTQDKNEDTNIQTRTLYGMAESFLNMVKSLEG